MKLQELNKKIEEVRELIKNRFLDKALDMMNIIIKDKENAENKMVVLEMGQVFLASENFSKAKIWFQKALNMDKDDIYAIKAMLRIACGLEDYETLAIYIKKIISAKDKVQDENVLNYLIHFLFTKLFAYKQIDDLSNISKIVRMLNTCQDYIKDVKMKNIIVNELEILSKKTILKSAPRILIISLTSKCNIKCKMCKVPLNHWEFPQDKIRDIYSLFPTLQKVVWHGGEPFFYPWIDDLIKEASKYNVEQVVSTNGLLLNEDRIKKIINAKMELNISIHGLTKDIYETIHRGGKFEILLKNLNIIKDIRSQSQENMKYGLKFLVMRTNYKQLKDLCDFALKYGFNHVHVNTLGNDTLDEENFIYHYENINIIKDVLKQSEIVAKKFRETEIMYDAWLPSIGKTQNKAEKQQCEKERREQREQEICCYMPWQSLVINIDGIVQNNCNCGQLQIGNINKDSINDIWNGNEIIKIRENMIKLGFDDRCVEDCKNGRISRLYLRNPV